MPPLLAGTAGTQTTGAVAVGAKVSVVVAVVANGTVAVPLCPR